MFADSLLDASSAERGHRRRTTLSSFLLQIAAVIALLLVSLLRVEQLPPTQWRYALIAPAPPPAAPALREARAATSGVMAAHPLSAPSYEPREMPPDAGSVALAAPDISHLGITGLRGPGVPFSNGSALPLIAPPPPTVSAKPAPVSRMMEGNLIHRVQPAYPALAKQARIQGSVVLRAIINREGVIENLQALSGPPVLEQAAIAAVKQWRYRPYLLGGEPIEVETQVTVNFSLGGQ